MASELVLPEPPKVAENVEISVMQIEVFSQETNNDDLHACPHCNTVFTNATFLSKHLKRKCVPEDNAKKKHKCEHCPSIFKEKRQLKQHMLQHSGMRPFKCDKCEKTFLTKAHLKRHGVIHLSEDEVPYKCKICGKGFAWSSLLESHLKTHSGEKEFKCAICARMFQYKGTLRLHITNRHMVDGFFHCVVCKERFQNVTKIVSHMKNHDQEKSVKCNRCTACFSTLKDLETHVCVNFGGHPLLCQFCPNEFLDTESFCNHSCMHNTTNRVCSCCKKEFKSIWHMKEHLITHCGEKPYQCKHCNLSFRRKRELDIHMTKHDKEGKIFQCELCPSSFTAENYLKRHMRKEHRKKSHICDICGHQFMFKSVLKTHREFHNRTGNTKYGKKNHRANELFVPGLSDSLQPENKTSRLCNEATIEPVKAISNGIINSVAKASETNHIEVLLTGKGVGTAISLPSEISSTVSQVTNLPKADNKQASADLFENTTSKNDKTHSDEISLPSNSNNMVANSNQSAQSFSDWEVNEIHLAPIDEGNSERSAIEKDILTGQTVFRCLSCLDVFDTHSSLLRHQKESHFVGKDYQCEICGRYFSLAANLFHHMNMHKNKNSNYKYSCKYCGNHFKVIYKLREHLRNKHNEINSHLTDLELHFQHNKDRDLYDSKIDDIQNDIAIDQTMSPLNFLCVQNDGDALLLNDCSNWTSKLTNVQNLGFFQISDNITENSSIESTTSQTFNDTLPDNSDFDVNSINNTNISYIGDNAISPSADAIL